MNKSNNQQPAQYQTGYEDLIQILAAIEHFFDDFFAKKFIIKYGNYTKTPRCPATVFRDIVQDAEESILGYGDTKLNDLVHVISSIKIFHSPLRGYFNLGPGSAEGIIEGFRDAVDISQELICGSSKEQAFQIFIGEWFSEHYPELFI